MSSPRFGHPEVFALMGAFSFLVARFLPVLDVPYRCPVKGALGIPCPTCGMTHAFVQLAHGHLGAALEASPAGALLAAAAWAYALLDAIRVGAGAPFPALPPRLVRTGILAGLAVVVASWAFVLLRKVGS